MAARDYRKLADHAAQRDPAESPFHLGQMLGRFDERLGRLEEKVFGKNGSAQNGKSAADGALPWFLRDKFAKLLLFALLAILVGLGGRDAVEIAIRVFGGGP